MNNFGLALLCVLSAHSRPSPSFSQEIPGKKEFETLYAASPKSASVDTAVTQKIKLLVYTPPNGHKQWALALPLDTAWSLEYQYVGPELSEDQKRATFRYCDNETPNPKSAGYYEVRPGATYNTAGEVRVRAIMLKPKPLASTGVVSLKVADAEPVTVGFDDPEPRKIP